MTRWIAADRGPSALRLTLMEGDVPLDTRESAGGAAGLAAEGFEPAVIALAGDWIDGAMQVIACGTSGAWPGRTDAPFRTVPCAPLGDAPIRAQTRDAHLDIRLVPGLRQLIPHADIMQGDETRVAGILRALPDFDGIVCLAGAHTRWARVSAAEIVGFRTVMTGEMFALLCDRSVLRHSLAGDGWEERPFLEAVSDTLSRPETLTARLFELHAEDLLHGQDAATGRSVLSGLLIGAELSATKPWWLGQDIVITGSDTMTRAYAGALKSQGVTARILPAAEMTLAGLTAARDRT